MWPWWLVALYGFVTTFAGVAVGRRLQRRAQERKRAAMEAWEPFDEATSPHRGGYPPRGAPGSRACAGVDAFSCTKPTK
jgi:hypothetical protein